MNLFMLIFEKQDPDIRINLQLNSVSIYTKFWTVSFINAILILKNPQLMS